MKAIRLTTYQSTAAFDMIPNKFSLTYPLPPYSTLWGLFHYVIDAEEFTDVKISVQGNGVKTSDYVHRNVYSKAEYARNIYFCEGLVKLECVIHFVAEEEVLEKFMNQIYAKNLKIGKKKDIINIIDVRYVFLNPVQNEDSFILDPIELNNNFYIPKKSTMRLQQPLYNLNFKYEVNNGIRQFVDKIPTYYVRSGTNILEDALVDEDGYYAFLTA